MREVGDRCGSRLLRTPRLLRIRTGEMAEPQESHGSSPHPEQTSRPARQVLGPAASSHQRAHPTPVLPPGETGPHRGQTGGGRSGGGQKNYSVYRPGRDGRLRPRGAVPRVRRVSQDRTPGGEAGGPRGQNRRISLQDRRHEGLAGGIQTAQGHIEARIFRGGNILLQAGDAEQQRAQPVQPPAVPQAAERGTEGQGRAGDRRRRDRGLPRVRAQRRGLRLQAEHVRGRGARGPRDLQARLQRGPRHRAGETEHPVHSDPPRAAPAAPVPAELRGGRRPRGGAARQDGHLGPGRRPLPRRHREARLLLLRDRAHRRHGAVHQGPQGHDRVHLQRLVDPGAALRVRHPAHLPRGARPRAPRPLHQDAQPDTTHRAARSFPLPVVGGARVPRLHGRSHRHTVPALPPRAVLRALRPQMRALSSLPRRDREADAHLPAARVPEEPRSHHQITDRIETVGDRNGLEFDEFSKENFRDVGHLVDIDDSAEKNVEL